MLAGSETPEAQHPMPAHTLLGPCERMWTAKTYFNGFTLSFKKFTCAKINFIGHHVCTGSSGHGLGHPVYESVYLVETLRLIVGRPSDLWWELRIEKEPALFKLIQAHLR
jgi:hypothetical protein